jgi:L-ascorbate metabolism protein UlaG (beta-lactamase superfamily)
MTLFALAYRRILIAVGLLGLFTLAAPLASAQSAKQFPCGLGFVENTPRIHQVAFRPADATSPQVQIAFVGHATFQIRSPQGIRVATDYNDFYAAKALPDIATMNIQRGNHSKELVDPAVRHVLRGWDTGKGIPRHNVRVKDVRVYNIPTNIERFESGPTNYSSMFVVEAAGLCIGHMGHVAHVLSKEQVRQMGRIDVLLAPVDRRVTQSMDELVQNLVAISPRLIVPMHYNDLYTVNEFAAEIGNRYPVKRIKTSEISVSRASLPQSPEIWILPAISGFDFGGAPL